VGWWVSVAFLLVTSFRLWRSGVVFTSDEVVLFATYSTRRIPYVAVERFEWSHFDTFFTTGDWANVVAVHYDNRRTLGPWFSWRYWAKVNEISTEVSRLQALNEELDTRKIKEPSQETENLVRPLRARFSLLRIGVAMGLITSTALLVLTFVVPYANRTQFVWSNQEVFLPHHSSTLNSLVSDGTLVSGRLIQGFLAFAVIVLLVAITAVLRREFSTRGKSITGWCIAVAGIAISITTFALIPRSLPWDTTNGSMPPPDSIWSKAVGAHLTTISLSILIITSALWRRLQRNDTPTHTT
jgi:hypothetical protein